VWSKSTLVEHDVIVKPACRGSSEPGGISTWYWEELFRLRLTKSYGCLTGYAIESGRTIFWEWNFRLTCWYHADSAVSAVTARICPRKV